MYPFSENLAEWVNVFRFGPLSMVSRANVRLRQDDKKVPQNLKWEISLSSNLIRTLNKIGSLWLCDNFIASWRPPGNIQSVRPDHKVERQERDRICVGGITMPPPPPLSSLACFDGWFSEAAAAHAQFQGHVFYFVTPTMTANKIDFFATGKYTFGLRFVSEFAIIHRIYKLVTIQLKSRLYNPASFWNKGY